MNYHVGTSGYSYPEWKGTFYPAKLPAKQMLGYYAARFGHEEVPPAELSRLAALVVHPPAA